MDNYFTHIIGNDPIKSYLMKLAARDTIPNSLLFAGAEGIGKSLFAEAFAKMIVRTDHTIHPDIHHYRPEGKIGLHSMESMREFCQSVYLAPFQGKKKVFIIHDAHRMLNTGANALLKTFEEPAPGSIIILISHSVEKLLPTVLSRCQIIRFQPLPREQIVQHLVSKKGMAYEKAKSAAYRAGGSLGLALKDGEGDQFPYRQALLNMLSSQRWRSYREMALFTKEIGEQLESTLKEEDASIHKKLLSGFSEKPSAVQMHAIEKDTDGWVAMKKMAEAKALFDILLSWFRDLHLLQVSGDEKHLFNPDYREQLIQNLQSGEILPLEKVEKAVSEALLALERSTSLTLCLENLFLKL